MSNGCLCFDLNMNSVDYGTRKKCFPDYDFHQGYSSTHLSNFYDPSNFCLFCACILRLCIERRKKTRPVVEGGWHVPARKRRAKGKEKGRGNKEEEKEGSMDFFSFSFVLKKKGSMQEDEGRMRKKKMKCTCDRQ